MQTTTEWIDESFKVSPTRWGTWDSYNKEGKKLVTSGSESSCLEATRFYLKGLQEGFTAASQSYEGTVGGKL